MTAEFGPLYAYVNPLRLEWWVYWVTRLQAGMTFWDLGTLDRADAYRIEDIFADPQIPVGEIELSPHRPASV